MKMTLEPDCDEVHVLKAGKGAEIRIYNQQEDEFVVALNDQLTRLIAHRLSVIHLFKQMPEGSDEDEAWHWEQLKMPF